MTIIYNPDPYIVMRRLLDDGRQLDIMPMAFGKYRLYIGQQNSQWYDDAW